MWEKQPETDGALMNSEPPRQSKTTGLGAHTCGRQMSGLFFSQSALQRHFHFHRLSRFY
jgi:hypothetical protein